MVDKYNICSCGFEAAEFASGLESIRNKINELRVHNDYKLTPVLIETHQHVAGHTLEHLRKVRDACNIETTEEEKRLIKIQSNLININNPDKRNELNYDVAFVDIGIRRKLYECAREK